MGCALPTPHRAQLLMGAPPNPLENMKNSKEKWRTALKALMGCIKAARTGQSWGFWQEKHTVCHTTISTGSWGSRWGVQGTSPTLGRGAAHMEELLPPALGYLDFSSRSKRRKWRNSLGEYSRFHSHHCFFFHTDLSFFRELTSKIWKDRKESLWIQLCSTKPFEQSLLPALPKQSCPQGSVNLSYPDLPSFQKNLLRKEGGSPSAPVRVCPHLWHRAGVRSSPALSSCSKVQQKHNRDQVGRVWRRSPQGLGGAGGDTGDRAQLQAGTEVPPGHCCPTHPAGSSDGSLSHHRQSKHPEVWTLLWILKFRNSLTLFGFLQISLTNADHAEAQALQPLTSTNSTQSNRGNLLMQFKIQMWHLVPSITCQNSTCSHLPLCNIPENV